MHPLGQCTLSGLLKLVVRLRLRANERNPRWDRNARGFWGYTHYNLLSLTRRRRPCQEPEAERPLSRSRRGNVSQRRQWPGFLRSRSSRVLMVRAIVRSAYPFAGSSMSSRCIELGHMRNGTSDTSLVLLVMDLFSHLTSALALVLGLRSVEWARR